MPVKTKSRNKESEAYCVYCKESHPVMGGKVITKKGRRMLQGTCEVCGTKMTRFLPKATRK